MWVDTMTRCDLPFIAYNVAKFGNNPSSLHFKSVTKALQYLKRMVDLLVAYGGGTADMRLSTWIDAENAACLDTWRSASGAAVMHGGGRSSGFPSTISRLC